jgi:hypothetical protein
MEASNGIALIRREGLSALQQVNRQCPRRDSDAQAIKLGFV